MASFMIKVGGEGLISKAHRLADSGPTSGYANIYEVLNCPDDVTVEQVIAAFKTFKVTENKYEIEYADLIA